MKRSWKYGWYATKYGLYEAVWAPYFYLPTVNTALRITECTSLFEYLDFGEFFLSFFLDPNIRYYAGVDITDIEAGGHFNKDKILGRKYY